MLYKKKPRSPPAGKVRAGRVQPFLILLAIPALLVIGLFVLYPGLAYLPAAFRNWTPPMSLADAPRVGWKWFHSIWNYYALPELIRNSLTLGFWDIALLPVPLVLALACQHCGAPRLKKTLDILSLVPAFIPSVIVVAVTQKILQTEGLLNQFLGLFGIPPENHLLKGEWFYAYFSLSGLWSGMGFPCLTYKTFLASSSRELHAAAQLDGAGLIRRIVHLDLPLCLPAFLVNLANQISGILCTSTERLMLFKNTANSAYATTLDLYAYELTFRSSMMPAYSKAIAFSLMTMGVNLILMCLARSYTSRKENIYA